jgi:5'-nucleotidase
MRPLILITNDDGILSPGLKALAETVDDLADILVVGPIKQQTGMGRSFPKHQDNGIIETFSLEINDKEITAYGIHGSPAFVVAHALLELVDRKPDLCLSGINYGENLGLSLTCSGTVGAAFEANSHGIHAIAFSKAFDLDKQHSENYEELNWEMDKKFVRRIIQQLLIRSFPKDIGLYNVNIPKKVDNNTKIRMTRQSRMNYSEFDSVTPRDLSKPYRLKTSISKDFSHLEHNTDIYTVIVDQCISVTPIRWDISIDDKIEFK